MDKTRLCFTLQKNSNQELNHTTDLDYVICNNSAGPVAIPTYNADYSEESGNRPQIHVMFLWKNMPQSEQNTMNFTFFEKGFCF